MRISFFASRDRTFLLICAVLFAGSAAGTIYWCGSMSGGMPMPGGWTMSMAWMRMPGQSIFYAAALFVAMWLLMMVAMMLPSIVPMLLSYRRTLEAAHANPGRLTAIAGAGYFLVWGIFGIVAYVIGLSIANAGMRWPAIARFTPVAIGIVLLIAGCVQLTRWKARHLARCCDPVHCMAPASGDAKGPLQFGMRLGLECALCCSAFMSILLVVGVMDLRAMAIVAVAITIERLSPKPDRVARLAGIAMIVSAFFVILRALRP